MVELSNFLISVNLHLDGSNIHEAIIRIKELNFIFYFKTECLGMAAGAFTSNMNAMLDRKLRIPR